MNLQTSLVVALSVAVLVYIWYPTTQYFGLLGGIADRKYELNECLRDCGMQNPTDSLAIGDILCEKRCYTAIENYKTPVHKQRGSRGWCDMMCNGDMMCVESCMRKWDVSDRDWTWFGPYS